jgi:hypothetical protein
MNDGIALPAAAASVEQAYGTDQVVEFLEQQIVRAREWQAQHVALVLSKAPDHFAVGHAGMLGLQQVARIGMRELDRALVTSIVNRTPPDMRVDPGADWVCFNCAAGPFNYDFLIWLVDAEMTRIRAGAPAPLKVGFWMGRDGKSEWLEHPSFRRMYENVMRPALALVGAVEDVECRGRFSDMFLPFNIVRAAREGEAVPRFRTVPIDPLPAEVNRGAVTITLRETSFWPHRNSNVPAWLYFAENLIKQGERVVIVRDTERAFAPLDGFRCAPLASIDLQARAELYAGAKTNLFVANGPVHVAMFLDVPYLIFNGNTQPEGHPYYTDTPSFWRERVGVEVGGQWPWAGPRQRMVWAKDDLENIERAWHELWA